jgi:hypothetical protein
VQTVRKIATGLRPEMLDDMGLIAAVAWQAKEFQKRTGIRCRAKLPPEVKFDIDISTAMFRIFQEILTNVARHSRATRVDIELTLGAEQVGPRGGRQRRRHPGQRAHRAQVARAARHAGTRAALRRRRAHHRNSWAWHPGLGDHPLSSRKPK